MGRLRKVKDDILKLQQSDYFIADPANIKLKEHNEIEVGTGKGQFITNKASSNPEINYYGIDKFPTILLKAINKLNKNKIDINNLHFLSFDALDLNKYFPNHSIDCIYLNFSDPWPKKRHEKRRLTSKTYINIYKSILRPDGCIKYKTDKEYYNHFKRLKNRSLYDTGVNIEESDNVLVLQTCIYGKYKGKLLVIVAKKVKEN